LAKLLNLLKVHERESIELKLIISIGFVLNEKMVDLMILNLINIIEINF